MTPDELQQGAALLAAATPDKWWIDEAGPQRADREALIWLRTYAADLIADAERLEWLDAQRQADIGSIYNSSGEPEQELRGYCWAIEGQCYDVRTAIDTARKGTP
jgi:hypothetical protein